jgi:hypothetical protein
VTSFKYGDIIDRCFELVCPYLERDLYWRRIFW